MIRYLLIKAWPALIPVIAYLIWLAIKRARARKADEPVPDLFHGPWVSTLGASLLVLGVCLFYAGLSYEPNAGASYQPMEYRDGELVPGTLK